MRFGATTNLPRKITCQEFELDQSRRPIISTCTSSNLVKIKIQVILEKLKKGKKNIFNYILII